MFCLVRGVYSPSCLPFRAKYISFTSQEYCMDFNEIRGRNYYHQQIK